MKDLYDRNITYARISLTDRCNLRCKYCMPSAGVDKKECHSLLRYEQIDNVIYALSTIGFNKIRFTGGEPLLRKDSIPFIIDVIKKYKDISFYITTNGFDLADNIYNLKKAGLKGVNISIDTLDYNNYNLITRGGNLDTTLNALYKSIQAKINFIKVNAVLNKEICINEISDLINLTMLYKIDVRFIELMPIGECASYAKENYISPSIILDNFPMLKSDIYTDISSPATYLKLPNAKGSIGFISPLTCKFCVNCNRIRITADGLIKTCLHSNDEYNIKPIVNDKYILADYIKYIITKKPKEHELEKNIINKNMKRIGG